MRIIYSLSSWQQKLGKNSISIYSFIKGKPTAAVSRNFSIQTAKYRKVSSEWSSKKTAIVVSNWVKTMAAHGDESAKQLEPLRASVKEQGDLVRSLKENGAPELDIKKAVNELKARKKILEDKELALVPKDAAFERIKLEDLLKRRFFYDISFSIYGGVSGQYDMGPMGCAMKTNLLDLWRKHFVLEEGLLEVDCTILTPEPVLKASGHVERFADVMVKDNGTGECFRLDHLIKGHLEKFMADKKTTDDQRKECEDVIVRLDGYSRDEMNEVVKKYNMRSPTSGNELSEPVDFNLMFSTTIGPGGGIKAFLRPETAQGIFVNFKRLLDFNQGKLPFGVAQIGNSFRNEISPRAGLIRVREFTMAEIEYFLDPNDKNHSRFYEVKDLKLNLYSACNQMDGQSSQQVRLEDAVANKLIANETLAYFMSRIHLFLIKVGVDPVRLRFRQHMANEMAHYACDCWDAEILTSYGWIECVGCADRSCFDLTQHTLATGVKLAAEKQLAQPKQVRIKECLPNKGVIGKLFKAEAKAITEAFSKLSVTQVDALTAAVASDSNYPLNVNGKEISISKDMVILKDEMKTVHVEEVTPSVIEPSFGIGRIMYAVWEHNFRQRDEDEQRTYLSLPPLIAPYKCSILPLSAKPEFVPFIQQLSKDLRKLDISFKIDDGSGSVGRRYARTDEIAIPFGVTIDFDTLTSNPATVTLRERDSREQLRIPLDDIPQVVQNLTLGRKTWEEVSQVYPRFTEQESKS